MKKKQLLLAMLLASSVVACSSSSDGDDDAARRAAEQKAAEEAAKKAAEEAAKAAEEARKKKEQVQIAGVLAGSVAEGTDAISDEEAAKLTVPGSRPGFLRTSNKDSNFVVNGNSNPTNDASKALEMTKQNLNERLDTVIVAYPHDKSVKTLGYVEDFQFGDSDDSTGEAVMAHIYINDGTAGSDITDEVKGREELKGTPTKTDFQGEKEGTALVYQKGRLKYFENNAAYAASGADVERGLGGTQAEVYGLRTFIEGGNPDAALVLTDAEGQVNLPLVTEVAYDTSKGGFAPDLAGNAEKGILEKVQYGRVTTSLHNAKADKYKKGSEYETVVVPYGEYGKAGTENVYFYRGIGNTVGKDLAALKDKGGKLTYHGHAVSYGLNNEHNEGIPGANRPNAIGSSKYELFSGNHVVATVDLETSKLTSGSIYNKWWNSTDGKGKDVRLVEFNGTLDNMGNITGTATRLTHSSANEGVLNATLYGSDAEELGGMVSSVDQTAANKWGAVFGAQAHKEAGKTTTTPSNPWAAATDENDNGKVD